ncbi:lanthionine synthetase C family protein [Calothrix sp. PCC 7716]|nr:lanthionine synthetase C family protein [Calothrix sp. PCC 7716]
MKVLLQDLVLIVEQASNLKERLSNQFVPDTKKVDTQIVRSRWQVWSQGVAKGNIEKFAKRLVWDNVNSSAVATLLGDVRLATEYFPEWANTLQEVFNTDWEACANADKCLDINKQIPFESLYLPFVFIARQQLNSLLNNCTYLPSEECYVSMERQLLVKLAMLCSQTLELEFSEFKALKSSTYTLASSRQQNGFDSQYKIFLQHLAADKLLSFFQKYSVLARLIGTAINFWVEEKAEFIQRLATDLPVIQQTFQADVSQLTEVKLNLSDPHNQGRSVIALTFASGFKLIYKPRGLGLEKAYSELLNWCNQQSIEVLFKIIKVIDSKTHGWMEYVEHLPCDSEQAVQRYYQRSGMILCLLYILQATDFHHENLIANGEHPVLIDLETLLQPDACDIDPTMEEKRGAQYLASKLVTSSVIRTGLLPRWEFDSQGNAVDDSGLGGVEEQEIAARKRKWQNVNTDDMVMEYETGTMSVQANTVMLGDTFVSPNNYLKEIIDGFETMYRLLSSRRQELLASDNPLQSLAHQKIRFLFRNSQIYADVLDRAQQPKYLQHGIDYSIKLDVLSRAMLVVDDKPPAWSLLAFELEAMEQMDIPYFVTDSNSDALMLKNSQVARYFKESGYDRMVSRLQQMSNDDLALQVSIIRSSFQLRITQGKNNTASTGTKSVLSVDSQYELTQAELVQEAVEIAKEIQKRAIHTANGSITWIGMEYNPEAGRYQLQPIGDSLYDGVCGIALFLASVAKVTGNTGFKDLAIGALNDLTESLLSPPNSNNQPMFMQEGIGAGSGYGSIIYTLVKISQFLEKPKLIEVASIVATLITKEIIENDNQFDLVNGAAGTILGLLSLYAIKPEPAILEQAVNCGHHLLNNTTQISSGFSHGTAGIAYALLQLFQITQQTYFFEAAKAAISKERSLFFPDTGNWADTKADLDDNNFMTSWCHGAPGIALGRLGSLSILDNSEIRREIEVAINTTKNFGLPNLDHLCCGNFGRIETLLVGASKLSLPELLKLAQKQAAFIVARKRKFGNYYLFPDLKADIFNPAFFQGAAGIGYQLLRLAYPESLPSVLLWE